MTTLYDPPGGWRWGFPRPYDPLPGETLEQTLVRDGYPANAAADGAKHCRFWAAAGNDNDNVPVAPQPEPPRQGGFIQTFTGRQFWPLDPRPDEVHIEDIAHALSNQCRFAGHVLRRYSVAEHSVHIGRWLLARYPVERALWGLLHDGSEAYLVDVPRPIKPHLTGYAAAELRVMAAICTRFSLPLDMPYAVKEADDRILIDERAQAMRPANYDGGWPDVPPLGVTLQFWTPEEAEEEFMDMYEGLVALRRAA